MARAFSMVELLVVLGIITILAVLAVPLWRQSRDSADRATASSQMRQIGLALFQYSSDRDGTLPGPLKSGQNAKFTPNRTDSLPSLLAPYLGVVDLTLPLTMKVFLPPAFVRAAGSDGNPYVMNISAQSNGAKLQPWGSSAAPVTEPMKLAAVPPSVWAFCDADQLNPHVIGQPWAGGTPKTIIHGRERLALYFDGRVGPISQSTLSSTAGGGGGGGPKPPPPPPR